MWSKFNVVSLQHQYPPKPLNNAQIRRVVLFYNNMKISYSKACTLPPDLIPLLKKRGLIISEEQRAISYLTNIGYFRLSAYLYPLLDIPKENHVYKNGATFDMALDIYRFDRKCGICADTTRGFGTKKFH